MTEGQWNSATQITTVDHNIFSSHTTLLISISLGVVSDLVFWQMIEVGIGVIAACLPTLHPVAKVVTTSRLFVTLRSAFSRYSRDRSRSSERSRRSAPPDAETASHSSLKNIVDYEDAGKQQVYAGQAQTESYALGPMPTTKRWGEHNDAQGRNESNIYVEDAIHQSVDHV